MTSTLHHMAQVLKMRSSLSSKNDRKLFSGLYDAVLYGFGPTYYYVDMHGRSVERVS